MKVTSLVSRAGLTILCAYFAANCAPAKFRAIHDRSGANQGGGDVEGGEGGDGDGSDGEGRVGEEGSLPDESTTIEKTFLVSAQAAASQVFGLTAGSVKEEIPLKSSGQNVSLSQISRPQVQKEFIQGQNASSYTDEFSQLKGAGVIDILIVMDNSGSMSQEQANMATKMAPLLSSINNASWKIGVVTTDRGDPCMRAVISKGDANATTAFQTAMSAGSNGDGEEHGLQMAVRGLNCTGTNWLRANSSLAVLIVSDEDNCSDGDCPDGSSGPYAYDSYTYVGDYMKNTLGRPLGTKARMYGIIWQPTDSSDVCPTGNKKGYTYSKAVAYTGGSTGSICAADYSSILSKMSSEMATTLQSQFVLKYTPNAGSVSVTVQESGSMIAMPWTDFTVSGNVITFTKIPTEGSTIKVSYQYGAATISKRFDLGEKPYAGSLEVMVDGAAVPATDYTLGADNFIEFGTAPAQGAVIKASFKSDVALLTEFNIGSIGIVDVKVDGVSTTNYTYDYASGKIVFASAPKESATIVVSIAQLTYPFVSMGDNPRDHHVTLKGSGKEIPYTPGVDSITIDAVDFVAGETLVVEYKNDASFQGKVELAYEPVPGSVKIDTAGAPDCTAADLRIEGRLIYWDCEVDETSELKVSYDRKLTALAEFTLDNPYDPNLGSWEVFVDDKQVFNYDRNNNTISFKYELKDGAKVTVKVSYEI